MKTDLMQSISSIDSNGVFENTPINRLRTAVIKVKNLKKKNIF